MRAFFTLRYAELDEQRPDGAVDDVHFPESLAQAVLDEFTSAGDVVLDPFAGYGTTLAVAERMGRTAVGVELLPGHAAMIRARLTGTARLVEGDARRLREVAGLADGSVDLCLTSPPYMHASGHPENPLTGYETLDGDYAAYLQELGDVFAQIAVLLRPGGHLVLNAANIVTDGVVTPLAWDMARVASGHLRFVGESFLCWDRQPDWMSGDYCLVFRRGLR